jgi:hypothetical protein
MTPDQTPSHGEAYGPEFVGATAKYTELDRRRQRSHPRGAWREVGDKDGRGERSAWATYLYPVREAGEWARAGQVSGDVAAVVARGFGGAGADKRAPHVRGHARKPATDAWAQRVNVTEIRQRARPDRLTRGPAVSAPSPGAGPCGREGLLGQIQVCWPIQV